MGAASPPVEHRAPPVDGGGGHQHSERKHGTLPHLTSKLLPVLRTRVHEATAHGLPWLVRPWSCGSLGSSIATPAGKTKPIQPSARTWDRRIFGDSWRFLRTLEGSPLRISNASLTNVSKSLKPKGQPTNLDQPANPTDHSRAPKTCFTLGPIPQCHCKSFLM